MKNQNSPAASILLPSLNVVRYIDECLASVRAQTLSDIEILCVDAGSTDGTRELLERHAAEDSRIRLLTSEVKSYGHQMNLALSAATGEYIGIVETDDAVLPEMYETLYRVAKAEGDLDIVRSDCYATWDSIGYRYRFHLPQLDEDYNRVLGEKEREKDFRFLMNIWTGIYRREFLREHAIRFHETSGAAYQDNGFWLQTLFYAKRTEVCDRAFYLYRQDNENASVKSTSNVMTIAREFDWAEREFRKRNAEESIYPILRYYRLMRNRGTFFRIADELKTDFLPCLIDCYEKYRDALPVGDWLTEWYQSFALDPRKNCEEILEIRHAVKHELEMAERLFIYGAGRRAEMALRFLASYGYASKLNSFVTTDAPKREKIGSFPVIRISAEVINDPNATIIVSAHTGTKMYGEMTAFLTSRGVSHWVKSTDIFENFYLLF